MKDVNLEIITDMPSWYRIWLLSGFNIIRAKPILLKQKRACKSSWSQVGNQKSFTLTVHQNLAKPVKIFPGIVVRQHLTVQKQTGLLRERYAGLNRERLRYCCNQVWMKIGDLTLWNAIAICEMSKTSWQMGKLFTKGDSENHLKDQ